MNQIPVRDLADVHGIARGAASSAWRTQRRASKYSAVPLQEATKLGLHITDVELANTIRRTPSFQRDGRFDEQFYIKQFKPYYERTNGQNFEYSLREDLLRIKFRQVLNQFFRNLQRSLFIGTNPLGVGAIFVVLVFFVFLRHPKGCKGVGLKARAVEATKSLYDRCPRRNFRPKPN